MRFPEVKCLLHVCFVLLMSSGIAVGQDFVFVAPDVVETYSGSSHDFDLTIQIEQTDTPLVFTSGMSCGLAHGGDEINVVDVEPVGILLIDEGDGPCFFGLGIFDDGWTLGAIWDAGGHGCGTPLMFDSLQPALRATYESEGLTEQELTIPLTWTNTLGNPNVVNTIVVQGQGLTPDLVDGSVTLVPQYFRRADCNADGTVDLVDDIVLLIYLFLNGSTPSCVAACDFNGDGVLSLPDAIFLELYLFLGGAPPPAPLLECGFNEGPVECLAYPPCP